jgi:hypothetical protein
MKTLTKITMIVAAMVFLIPLAARNAGAQPEHPAYLHALADLRDARAHLERPDGGALHADERSAVEEIDRAISEIKKAAIDDGKNIDDHVHVDANRPGAGRLHDAHDLLSKAHHDVAQEEDNPTTRGLRDRVLSHIDKASYFVDKALGDEKH